MKRSGRVVVAAAAMALALSLIAPMMPPASAGGRVFVGVGVGFPFWGFPYPYAYPYAYPYPAYPAYAPPVVVQSQPTTYVQQETPAYWYYCQASQAYYPYVNECQSGWIQVPPQPPTPGAPPR